MTLARTSATTCAGIANFAVVTVTYQFETVVPVLIEALADGKTLRATACFPNNK